MWLANLSVEMINANITLEHLLTLTTSISRTASVLVLCVFKIATLFNLCWVIFARIPFATPIAHPQMETNLRSLTSDRLNLIVRTLYCGCSFIVLIDVFDKTMRRSVFF